MRYVLIARLEVDFNSSSQISLRRQWTQGISKQQLIWVLLSRGEDVGSGRHVHLIK